MNEFRSRKFCPAQPSGKASLFEHPDLWRAGELPSRSRLAADGLASGFPELDEHLPGHGWPQSGLAELLLPSAGIGELRLLLPLLAEQSRKMRWIAWVQPPFMPYAPALEAAGVDVSKILVIHPQQHKDALWALERASGSGTCSTILAWLDERELTLKDTRRLKLAAKRGDTLTCLFRPRQAAAQTSMAELRLGLEPASAGAAQPPAAGLKVSILKRRGGWPVPDLELTLPEERGRSEIREQLSLWRFWREHGAGPGEARPPAAGLRPEAAANAANTERPMTH